MLPEPSVRLCCSRGRRSWMRTFRIVTLALATACGVLPSKAQLEIRFLDVGQGDAILIREGAHAALIDAGLPDDSLVGHLRALGVDSLQVFIASHNHGDHIGAAGALLMAIPVVLYIENDAPLNTPSHQRVEEALRQRGIPREVAPRRTIRLGSTRLDVIPPPPGVDTAQNNHSMVVLIQRAGFRALLTGDSERSEIEALLLHENLPRVDVLKAPHHGDPEALSAEWLQRLTPAVVVVSVAAGNLAAETLTRYADPRRRIFSTDREGDVTVCVDSSGAYRIVTGPHRAHQTARAPTVAKTLFTR